MYQFTIISVSLSLKKAIVSNNMWQFLSYRLQFSEYWSPGRPEKLPLQRPQDDP